MMTACVVLCLAAFSVTPATAAGMVGPGITKVTTLIKEFKGKIEEEAKTEQLEYDRYACWCEDSLSTKANEISQLKAAIQEIEHTIIRLKGMLGRDGAEVAQLNVGIAANTEATEGAQALREKEAEAYKARRLELEQYIGALEAAINALSGKGTSSSLLAKAQILSAAGSLGDVLADARVPSLVSPEELEVVREFAKQPTRFVRGEGPRSVASFLESQAKQANPFGDYSSKTGQVQGVLKAMYDAFALELEKANAQESAKIEPFEQLMALKAQELASFHSQVGRLNSEHGDVGQALASAQEQLHAAKNSLGGAEAFFGGTSAACREKAAAWAKRTSLRSGELEAIQKAIDVLESPEAQALFGSAPAPAPAPGAGGASLLQVGDPRSPLLGGGRSRRRALAVRNRAYEQLAGLTRRYGTLGLANIAAEVRFSTGGHFEKVVELIDKLVAKLKQDGKDDAEKREYCASETGKNEASKNELNRTISKTTKAVAIQKDRIAELESEVAAIDARMNSTKAELAQISEVRAAEAAEHEKALLESMFAIRTIKMARIAIQQFYKDNGYVELQTGERRVVARSSGHAGEASALALAGAAGPAPSPAAVVVMPAAVPVTEVAPPPETSFDSKSAGASAAGAQGIVDILDSIVDSIDRDTQLSKTMEATAMAQFVATRKQMLDLIEEDKDLRFAKHKDLVQQQAKQANKLSDLQQAQIDKGSVEEILAALAEQCAWVSTHFESRATKRQAEIDGLNLAKHILLGAAEDHKH